MQDLASGAPHSPSGAPNDRRIAACVKACEGIPTEKLEDGVLMRLVAACIHVDDAEIRAAVDDLGVAAPRTEREKSVAAASPRALPKRIRSRTPGELA